MRPLIIHHDKFPPHPSPLQISENVYDSLPQPPTYAATVPQNWIKNESLSAEQFWTLCLIARAWEQWHGEMRMAFQLNAGTGTGKTRICLAAVFHAMKRGADCAVILSKNKGLHSNLHDEMRRLGIPEEHFFPTLEKADNTDVLFGNLKMKFVYTTYAMLTQDGRREQLYKLMQSRTCCIILDESHGVKNPHSKSGSNLALLLDRLPNAFVLSMSATTAMELKDFHLLAKRFGLIGSDGVFKSLHELNTIAHQRSVMLAELVFNFLVSRGVAVSYSAKLEGVDKVIQRVAISETHMVAYDGMTQIIGTFMPQIANAIPDSDTRLRNRILQMLKMACYDCFDAMADAIKAAAGIEMARAALTDGQSPVLQVAKHYDSTNPQDDTSLMARITTLPEPNNQHDNAAAHLSEFNDWIWLTPLRQFFQAVLKIPLNFGVSESSAKASERILQLTANAVYQATQYREVMPLTAMHQITAAFGSNELAELSGRATRRNADGSIVPLQETGADAVAAFNTGKKWIIVITSPSSTGHSLHSSPHFINQRQRMQIVISTSNNVAQEMQAFGRTERTGSVIPPILRLLIVDGLMRELAQYDAMIQRFRKLSAGTHGCQQALTSADNLYTSERSYGEVKTKHIQSARVEIIQYETQLRDMLTMFGVDDTTPANVFFKKLCFAAVDTQHALLNHITEARSANDAEDTEEHDFTNAKHINLVGTKVLKLDGYTVKLHTVQVVKTRQIKFFAPEATVKHLHRALLYYQYDTYSDVGLTNEWLLLLIQLILNAKDTSTETIGEIVDCFNRQRAIGLKDIPPQPPIYQVGGYQLGEIVAVMLHSFKKISTDDPLNHYHLRRIKSGVNDGQVILVKCLNFCHKDYDGLIEIKWLFINPFELTIEAFSFDEILLHSEAIENGSYLDYDFIANFKLAWDNWKLKADNATDNYVVTGDVLPVWVKLRHSIPQWSGLKPVKVTCTNGNSLPLGLVLPRGALRGFLGFFEK